MAWESFMPTAPPPAFFFQFRQKTGRKVERCLARLRRNRGSKPARTSRATESSAPRVFYPTNPLKVVLLIEGIDLFAGRRDLLAKLFVISLRFLITKVRFSRVPRLPVLIEKA